MDDFRLGWSSPLVGVLLFGGLRWLLRNPHSARFARWLPHDQGGDSNGGHQRDRDGDYLDPVDQISAS